MLMTPTYDDVVAAAERVEGHAHRTPVLTSRTANEDLGADVFFKCENFQRAGAFKFESEDRPGIPWNGDGRECERVVEGFFDAPATSSPRCRRAR
jgi:hypothetical protein